MSPADCARLRLAPSAGLKKVDPSVVGQVIQVVVGLGSGEKWTSRTDAGRKEVGSLKTLNLEVKLDSY
jgi:hypothetical protein